jgi:hypothetical protein
VEAHSSAQQKKATDGASNILSKRATSLNKRPHPADEQNRRSRAHLSLVCAVLHRRPSHFLVRRQSTTPESCRSLQPHAPPLYRAQQPEDEVESGSEIYDFTDEDGSIHSREFFAEELIPYEKGADDVLKRETKDYDFSTSCESGCIHKIEG